MEDNAQETSPTTTTADPNESSQSVESVEATPAPNTPPKVSVITCISNPVRLRLCRRTINQFMQYQVYLNYELIIVNSTGESVTDRKHPQVTEIQIEPHSKTLGGLRNVGLGAATGDWVITIDDDDYSHPYRILYQLAYRSNPQACILLQYQTRVAPSQGILYFHGEPQGIANSIMFPRTDGNGGEYRYDETLTEGEDVEFLQRNFGDNRVIIANGTESFPGPAMMVCFWHGQNLLTIEQFMGEHADSKYANVRPDGMSGELEDYIAFVLRTYGYEIQPSGAEGPEQQIGGSIY